MDKRFDFHLHSNKSDGDFCPADVVKLAAKNNLSLIALTDHDTVSGVDEAVKAGGQLGVRVLSGVELDLESPFELHILGLGVGINDNGLLSALDAQRQRRYARNDDIVAKLKKSGYDIRPFLKKHNDITTRVNVALALIEAGFAKNLGDAFLNFLAKGRPGYCAIEKITPKTGIELILNAGGVPVLAHPCKIAANHHALVNELAGMGLKGIEAFYPTCTDGQVKLFLSLAKQYGLLVTSGSDFHGSIRKNITPGCAWVDCEELAYTKKYIEKYYFD